MYEQNLEILKQIDITLYNKLNTYIQNKKINKNKTINHKYQNIINELVITKYNKKRTIIEKDEINYIKDLNFYIKYINKFDIISKKRVKYYEKFIFFSQNNNYDLNKFLIQNDIKIAFFIENNLNDLALLLHNIDLLQIIQKTKVIFYINNIMNFEQKIEEFLNFGFDKRYFIHYLSDNKYNLLLQNFLHILPSFSNYHFTYSKYLLAYKNSKYAIKKDFKFLIFNKKNLQNYPIFYIGSAPSLNSNIKYIKNYQSKVIIITITSALKILYKQGIIPDIIISIDSRVHKTQLNKLQKKYFKKSHWIVSAKSIKYLKNLLPLKKTYLIQTDIALADIDIFEGNSVGEIGLDIILRLSAKKIYLFGFDASIDKNGFTHIKSHTKKQFKTYKTNILKNNSYDINNDILEVKGNFQKKVFTTRTFYELLINYSEILKNHNALVYNLSNGAYIKYTIPLKPKKLKIKSKINKSFNLNSTIYKININKNIKKEFKLYIQKQKDIKITSINDFKNSIIKTTFDLIGFNNNLQDSIINQIFIQYFRLINPYIYYILNTTNSINIKQIKKIHKHWIKQIKRLINEF